MAQTPERVLAIDVASEIVRGIVLTGANPAVAGGYAQLGFDKEQGPAPTAARIAAALDVKSTLPVVVTCDASLGQQAPQDVVAAIEAGGFSSVTIDDRQAAVLRTNPGGGVPTSLVGADIAAGLLTSHAGLTLGDLAAVVGAGLGLLGGGDTDVTDPDETVEVWSAGTSASPTTSADAATEAKADADPFTSAPAAGAAAAAAGASALGAVSTNGHGNSHDETAASEPTSAIEDDPTMPPSATPSAAPTLAEDEPTTPAEKPAPTAVAPTVKPELEPTAAAPAAKPDPAPVAPVAAATAAAAAASVPAAEAPAVTPANLPPGALPISPPEEPSSNDNRRSKSPLLLLLGALVLAAIIALAITQCGGDDDVATGAEPEVEPTVEQAEPTAVEAAAAEPAEEPTAAESEAEEDSAAATTDADEPTPEPDPTPDPEPEPTADPLEGLPPLSDLPERGAVFRPPTLFLEGPVQTQEEADALYERAIAVVGPDNVVNNYVVRPDAPPALDGNVRVEQAVLFATGSAEVSEQFIPTLELGVAVMALNPQVQMVVEGHTDSVGTDASNQELSEDRAQAVVDYLVSRGVAADRLDSVGFGESAPVASNETAEGRQINRRIEVNLLDLLAE